VIPARVKQALNVLSEGVVLMDQTGRIVLANTAFEKRVQAPTDSLLGRKLSDLEWTIPGSAQAVPSLPWNGALNEGKSHTGMAMSLSIGKENARTFVVNASPILDDRGNTRGALSTFDDVTELEEKNEELQKMLKMLDASRGEVRRQNQKLQVLATRDTLTGCLNRRSFFERLELEVENARKDDLPLSCVMADIDHFKSINDTHGHAMGDKIIREIADALRMGLRGVDLLGRYGGEEFCIVLPGVSTDKSAQIAERLRSLVAATFSRSRYDSLDRPVTMSFGVSTMEEGVAGSSQLVDHADRALYEAKKNGRNCVKRWEDIQHNDVAFG
jgi:diguanylate cyclase (GGDEF)-like protein/PAS domain S-box-containing protein